MTDIAREQANRAQAEIPDGRVVAVSRDAVHHFSKVNCESITLLAGLGVEGDAHLGVTVKHRSRLRRDPSQPNLRPVHRSHVEVIAGVNLPMLIRLESARKAMTVKQAVAAAREAGTKYISVASELLGDN